MVETRCRPPAGGVHHGGVITGQHRTDVQPAPLPEQEANPDRHLVTTLNRGAFVHATCVLCPWDGPARRAYASADRDADRHLLT